jgi:Na+/H+ antiporter NhaD/arsenite permease-like protein
MFQKILARKGLTLTYIQYARMSFFVIAPALVLSLFSVWVELL